MKCTGCGAEFEEGTLFCPVCGREVQWVPEYNTLETLIRQREIQEKERKRKELEAQKEREREERRLEQERQRRRRKRRTVAGVVGALVIAAGAGLFYIYQTQINSFDFQLAQAETEFSNKDYENALKYTEKALELNPDSPEAQVLEAKIYLKQGNEKAAESMLLSIVSAYPDNTSAYGELLRFYEQKEDYVAIRDVMEKASDEMKETYQNYVCQIPEISKEGGTYAEELSLTFTDIPQNGEVYYTLNGSQPDKNSTKYEGAVSLEEEGTYVLRYVAYNQKSVPSQVGEQEYVIQFGIPDKPKIAPVSGRYETSTSIIVTAPEGCTVYYAFDQEPTLESEKYTEPLSMPEGEHTFSAIAVDKRGKVSAVASEVYVYYGE